MADAKQDNKKKEVNSEGVGFKTVMGGFDKNEVNLYIAKLRKQMKEQNDEYEKRLNNLQSNLEDAHKKVAQAKSEKKTAEQAAATASAPIIKDSSAETKKIIADLKAESDKKIMELRKSILDERRNVAKFDKECAMAKMSEKKIREEFEKLKNKYHELKKSGGGASGKAVATSNADEVMAEASAYAQEMISAAKSYSEQAVKAADKYKADVEAELKERSDKINEIKKKLADQIKKTESEQAESAKKVKEATSKISSLTSLFESFTTQFNSVNSQITGVSENIESICKQFGETTDQIGSVAKQITETTSQISSVSKHINETTSQISSVSKQINETTSQISSVSKQINETSSQITGFAKSISETTEKINDASKQMSETSDMITEASKKMNETTGIITETTKKMNETSGLIDEASKKLNGFGGKLDGAKSDITDITKLVDVAKNKLGKAKDSVSEAKSATDSQASATDLSPIAKIGEELSSISGDIKAKLEMPKFDDSKFSDAKFSEITKKLRIETKIEASDGSTAADSDDDEFEDSDIISSIEIDSPDTELPSDDDLMADIPDVITAPVFDDEKPAAKKAESRKEDKSAKTERPGLDSDFEDFFLTEPKDDDLSGDIPLINMEGVGVIDDFSLDASPEPSGADFDITPIDKAAKPDKGSDLGADIFDIAIDPAGTDDDTLANMMADAEKENKAANKDLTPEDLNFDADDALPSKAADDDFGEFADLFAAGSSQTVSQSKKNDKPAFKTPQGGDDDWGFGSDPGSDSDLSDLLI
jgi:ABC-type transporter Mla subunit MlaD